MKKFENELEYIKERVSVWDRYTLLIQSIYENNPLAYTAMIWLLGAVTSGLSVYLLMR